VEDALPEAAARQFVESYGAIARSILEQRAENSEQNGYHVSARAYRDIASAAGRLLKNNNTRVHPHKSTE
jgi:hypothetical protein